jgi:serine protease Do
MLLALVVSLAGALAQTTATNARPPVSPTSTLAFPKPAPAVRAKLPAPFTKAVPTSVADLKVMERLVQGLVSRLSPAVVVVEVGSGTGSGIVITPDGLVLTAGHVNGRAGRDVNVRFPSGRSVRGKTLGSNSGNDTGLLKITEPGPWPFAPVGDLESTLLGDWVLALGHPGGFDAQRSRVARLGRIIQLAPGVLQTDCTISPGDSGGPLFDMHGRVIGIHSFISTSMAENFHVPITKFRDDWKQLAAPGAGTPPAVHLGATIADDANGCRIATVEPRTPAARAGLKAGDRVLKVEGRDIKSAAVFQRWLAEAQPGETLAFEIKRGQATLHLTVKLEAQPTPR